MIKIYSAFFAPLRWKDEIIGKIVNVQEGKKYEEVNEIRCGHRNSKKI